jgi:hypothetical protein
MNNGPMMQEQVSEVEIRNEVSARGNLDEITNACICIPVRESASDSKHWQWFWGKAWSSNLNF